MSLNNRRVSSFGCLKTKNPYSGNRGYRRWSRCDAFTAVRYARHIKAGQRVEVAFKFMPGRVYSGSVAALLPATALGQVQATGTAVRPTSVQPHPFVVRVELDDRMVVAQIPAGTTGEAAIYTDSVKATHIIRRVMIRMSSYLDYLIPF